MRSLLESIFDKDNVTKDYTFGDLFKLDENASRWEHYPLDKQFSVQRIKKVTKVSGNDNNEIIFKGIAKVIEDIKLEGNPKDMNKEWLFCEVERVVWGAFLSSMRVKRVYVLFLNNGHLILDRDMSLFEDSFDTIQINIGPDLGFVFKRK